MSNSQPAATPPRSGPPTDSRGEEVIRVRGARVHNLKNIDLEIPRDKLVALTGLSGSGKSSLAFDTLFAEGQRQYVESLSVYARQFVTQVERPDVDLIEGLEPTVCIDQRAGSHNPRSTVATVCEVYDYLRLLYARAGNVSCHQCGAAISQQTPEQILNELLRLGEGAKAMILAPYVRGRKGRHPEAFEAIRKAGFNRVRVDGRVEDLEAVGELPTQKAHTIEAVVDRIVVREANQGRIAESLQLALKHGEGLVTVARLDAGGEVSDPAAWRDTLYSTLYACPECRISYEALEPRHFSFNSPYGACPRCEGLGSRVEFDPDLVVPDPSLSLADGAALPWRRLTKPARKKLLAPAIAWLKTVQATEETPLDRLAPPQFRALFFGDGSGYGGLAQVLAKELATATDEARRDELSALQAELPCPDCQGARLRPEARGVRIGGRAIHEVTALPIAEGLAFFRGLRLEGIQAEIGARVVREIVSRLEFLDRVGVGYLTLDRPAGSLSGGESQRVRLATGIGSGLVGVCYVLDEPTAGLHPRDRQRLIESLRSLQEQGNSVLVVEHDEAVIRAADHVIDLGPGAGRHGGQVVAQGRLEDLMAAEPSLTGAYLSGRLRVDPPRERRTAHARQSLVVEGASGHNLRNLTVRFPLHTLTCVTGVSGSGKSTLVHETLARALLRKLSRSGPKPAPHTALKGANLVERLVIVDQAPLGRSPRSNPATYTGLFDEIRKAFAATREAKALGYKANRFSFNVAGGRCEECQGQGTQRIEMNFLPDLHVPCPVCEGRRFNRQTLEIPFRGRSIADVLALSVEEALGVFENFAAMSAMLKSLADVGLGYITLGQPATTLSGGESQRIKLAAELGRGEAGHALYILDEPTTGLHFEDIRRLLAILHRLVDAGHTVLVIEHQLDVIRSADWLIDLGPGGGPEGGSLVAQGPPEVVAACPASQTAAWLRAEGPGSGPGEA